MKKEDFQEFFKQRMAEIMHKDTLDSYRVRANNAHTILRELSYVLEGWLAGNVKRFETVGLCIDEAINLIENDSRLIFPSYTKALFVGDLKSYASISKGKKDMPLEEETSKLIYLVNECLASNDGVYLANLIKSIEAQVKMEGEIEAERFSPKLREFDGLLSSFACELLTIGYSKRYLYKFFNSFKKNRRGLSFEDAFSEMKLKFTELKQLSFYVVIKLNFKYTKNAQRATDAVGQLKEEILDNLKDYVGMHKSFLKKRNSVRFYIKKVNALDAYMAVRETYNELSKLLDYRQDLIYGYTLPNYALAFWDNEDGYLVTSEKFFELDNGGQFLKDEGNHLYEKLNRIDNSESVTTDVKDRITAALRHLRIGDGQVELEQQFINYWIALEFIFASSSSKDNTYSRIKENLVNILSACYVKRNLLYLENWMHREGILNDEDDLIAKINEPELVAGLDSILLKYRITNMKSHLHHKDKVNPHCSHPSCNSLISNIQIF